MSEKRVYGRRLDIVKLVIGSSMLLIPRQVASACQVVGNHRIASLLRGDKSSLLVSGVGVAGCLGVGLGGGCGWGLGLVLIQMLVVVALDGDIGVVVQGEGVAC